MPMTTSRTVSLAVKWRSVCGVRGMAAHYVRLGCVELRAVPDVGDELLHVERLAVDHENGIFQIAVEVMLRNGRSQDGPIQELWLVLAHVRQDRVAIHARHHEVEQDDAVAVLVEIPDGLDAVAGGIDAETLMPHDRRQHGADGVVIIDDQCLGL